MKKMLRSALVIIAAVASLGQIAEVSPARADTLVSSGGILTGVNGINVGGTSYDVTFAQGTCATVYGACNTSNFPFQTASLADAAITALFSDINASPTYQYNPSHIGLCTANSDCVIYLPLSDAASTISTDLLEIGLSAFANGTNLSAGGDTIAPDTASLGCTGTCREWSVWTAETTSAVPEPSAVTLLGAGLLGLAFIGWRRRLDASS